MPKDLKRHLATSAVLASVAAAGIVTAYQFADEQIDGVSAGVRVETVEVDFQASTQAPEPQFAQADSQAQIEDSSVQSQFLFLLALTVLGMFGIIGLVKDLRHSRHQH